MQNVDKFSATMLKMFLQCPRKFEYRYLRKLPEEKNVWAVTGTSVHTAIQYGHDLKKDGAEYNEIVLPVIEKFDTTFCELDGYSYGPQSNKLYKESQKMLREYAFDRDPEIQEHYFEIDIDGIIFVGYIDQLYPWGFVDLKTSRNKPNKVVLDNDPQFIIYSFAYRGFYGKDVDKAYWHHLRTGEDIEANVDTDHIYRLEELASHIQKQEFFPRSHSVLCNYCSFKDFCFSDPS